MYLSSYIYVIATLRTGLINGNTLMTYTTDTLLPQRIIEITTCVCGNNSIQQYDSMMHIENNEPTNTIHYTCCMKCLSLELER